MTILRSLWGIWVLITWIIPQIILFVLIIIGFPLMKYPFYQRFLLNIAFISTNFYSLAWLAFVQVKNKSILPANQTCVIVSNHTSMFDIIANAYAAQGFIFKFLAKYELTKIPIMGFVIKHMCVCVKRDSKEDRSKSYSSLKMNLANGFHVLVYPEGTRNVTNELIKPFYDGAFKLVKENNIPLVVCTLIHSNKINHPRTPMQWNWGKVIADYSMVIYPEEHEKMDVESLKNVVRTNIIDTLNKYGVH